MELVSRKQTGSALSLIAPVIADLARPPLMLAIGFGVVWRFTGLGLTPVVDRTIELLCHTVSAAGAPGLGRSGAGDAAGGGAAAGGGVGGEIGTTQACRELKAAPRQLSKRCNYALSIE
jgi:hypothetical protein